MLKQLPFSFWKHIPIIFSELFWDGFFFGGYARYRNSTIFFNVFNYFQKWVEEFFQELYMLLHIFNPETCNKDIMIC